MNEFRVLQQLGVLTLGFNSSYGAQEGKTFVSFRLNSQVKVETMNLENLAEFTRVAEKKAEAANK